MGNVDSDPLATQLLGGVDCRATPAKRIENDIAFIGAGANDPLQKRQGFLCGIPKAFWGAGVDWREVIPNVGYRNAGTLVEVNLLSKPGVLLSGKKQPSLTVKFLHHFQRNGPSVWMRAVQSAVGCNVVILEIGPDARISKIDAPKSSAIRVQMNEMFGDVCFAIWDERLIPCRAVRSAVEQKNIMNGRKFPGGVSVGARALPDDLIDAPLNAEYRVHEDFQVVACRTVAMQVEASSRLQNSTEFEEPNCHHREVRHHVVLSEKRSAPSALMHTSRRLDDREVAAQAPEPDFLPDQRGGHEASAGGGGHGAAAPATIGSIPITATARCAWRWA
jgi:hypothetical protein